MAVPAIAQPVVDSTYMPVRVTAASLNMSGVPNPADQAAPQTGLNQTWDYTRFNNPGEIDFTQVKDQGQYSFPAPVSGADHVLIRGLDAPAFFRSNTAGLSILGTDNVDSATVWDEYLYERPRVLLPLGLRYLDTFGDSILVLHRANSPYDTTVESYRAQYVGAGTLMVNGGTYANTILVHETSATYEPTGTGWRRTSYQDAYLWYGTSGLGVPLGRLLHIVRGSASFYRIDFFNQITATRPPQTSAAYLPTPGRASLWANSLTTTVPPSDSANAIWDYSRLQQSPQAPAFDVVYAPGSIFRPGVTDCNVALVENGVGSPTQITYARRSAAGLYAIGEAAYQYPASRYRDSLPLLPIPFVLGQSRYDSTLLNDSTAIAVRMRFAGMGTLLLVGMQNLPNTLMLKVQRRTYHLGNTTTMSDSSLSYEFYSAGRAVAPFTAREIFHTRFTPILSRTHGVQYQTDFITDTRPESAAESFVVSPNPAQNRIHLSRSGKGGIVDTMGRVVLIFDGNQVDVSTLPIGLYEVLIEGQAGTIRRRFVKE